jgi:membrane-bound lytic murein transglycosylase A
LIGLSRWRAALVAAAIVAITAACSQRGPTPAVLSEKPADFNQLVGWSDDNVSGAIPAFLKSCAAFLARGDGDPLDPRVKSGDFGTAGEWREVCAGAARLSGTDTAAKAFFEANFTPLLVGSRGDDDGLFTGYFEVELNGSRRSGGKYRTPIYRRPADPKAYSHAEIARGVLAGKNLELVWVDDPIAAYFLQIQGSGVVRLPDGSAVRIGYDGGNGRPYVAIGRLLVERGEIPLKDLTMASLRDWIGAHGDAGVALTLENPNYVFFKEIAGDGPLGSEGVVLTARRSLAVDRDFIPLGVPLWLDARQRFTGGAERRLVIAQDTGGAIKGPVRGDLFWGSGEAASAGAGMMNAAGRYYLLLPKAVAARQTVVGK